MAAQMLFYKVPLLRSNLSKNGIQYHYVVPIQFFSASVSGVGLCV